MLSAKYRHLMWPQQERTVNGKTEFLLFYPVSVSTLDTLKKKLRSYLRRGLPAVVLAWHTGALGSSASTTGQTGAGERDTWRAESLNHGMQLEAASGDLQTITLC